MKEDLSIDHESFGDQLAMDIQAVTRHRDRIEAVLREIGYAPEAQGREKLLELYQALPQVRVLAATYAVPPDEIRRVTRSSTLSEDERKEFLNLADRLRGLYNIPQRLKEVLPDLFHVPALRRSPLNLILELQELDDKVFLSRLSGEGVTTERRFELDAAILEEARLVRQAAENQERLPPHTAESLGRRLGRSVLGADATEAILQAVGQGRRVRIFLPPASTTLLPLPWETLLRGPDLAKLLPNVAVVRGRPKSAPVPSSLPPLPPVRVLLILSSPLDLGPRLEIQVERERERMMEPLRPLIAKGGVRLKVLDIASRARIREALSSGYHLVHFIGHGMDGGLLIEDGAGNGQVIPAADVASLFTEGRSAMVWLTACRSATDAQGDSHGSVAEALAAIGIPAVVAMRYSLTYDAGRRLGEAFYHALAAGKRLEEALESARNAVFLADHEHVWADWTIPALFSHSPTDVSLEWQENIQPVPRRDWLSGLNRLDQGFVGRRNEIREIKEALTSGGKRVVVIHGLPGMGKSVLAGRVIEDLQDEFNGIFARTVSRDEETGRPNLDFLGLLRELDYFLRAHDVTALSEAAKHEQWPLQQKLQQLYTALQVRRFLIVLDNAEDLLDPSHRFEDRSFEELLKQLLATGPQSRLLLTTRRVPQFPQEGRSEAALQVIPLDRLKDQEARELLSLREEARRLPTTDVETLLTRAQGMPLALVSYLALAQEQDRLREVLACPPGPDVNPVSGAIADLVGQLPSPLRHAGARAALLRGPSERAALNAAGLTSIQINELRGWSLLLHIRDADLYIMHPHVRLRLAGILPDNERRTIHGAIAAYLAQFRQQFAEEYRQAQPDPSRSRAWLARALHLAPSGNTVDIALEEHHHRQAAGDEEGSGTLLEQVANELFTTGRLQEMDRLIRQTPDPILACKAWLRVWQARIYETRGQLDEAIQIFEAIRSDTSAESEARRAATFDSAANALDRGDHAGAEASYRQLLDANPDNDAVKVLCYYYIGHLHQLRGEYSAALECYTQSLALAERIGDVPGVAASYGQIGTLHQLQGDYQSALGWYQRSLALAERLGNLAGMAVSYHHTGLIHQLRGDYPAALEFYQKSLELAERMNDLSGIATSYGQIGVIYQLRGDYPAALELYQKSLAIKETLGDQAGIATSCDRIGTIYRLRDDYSAALEWYKKSLAIRDRLNDMPGLANSYDQIGVIHQLRDDHQDALEWHNKSLAIRQQLRDPAGTAISYYRIAMTHLQQGDSAVGLKWSQKALEIRERLSDLAGIGESLFQIGSAHAQERNYKEAIRHIHTALLMFVRIGSPMEKLARSMMGQIGREIGEEEFKRLLTEVLGQQEKKEAPAGPSE